MHCKSFLSKVSDKCINVNVKRYLDMSEKVNTQKTILGRMYTNNKQLNKFQCHNVYFSFNAVGCNLVKSQRL